MSQRLTALPKLVVSSTLSEPLEWANTLLLPGDAVEMMPRAKRESQTPMRTMGSVSMVSNLVDAGLVDRLRLMVFPLSCGSAGREHIFATGALKRWELDQTTVLDQRVVLLEYQMTG